jgi:hypothetical protein
MMDETKPLGDVPALPDVEPAAASPEPAAPTAPATPATPATPEPSAAVVKFRSCRWRCDPDMGEFCTHRDVLPFAGKEGFKPESWCPECAFFKLRRTPKKRNPDDYRY